MQRAVVCVVALLAVAAFAGVGQQPVADPPQRWEYATLSYSNGLGTWGWSTPPTGTVRSDQTKAAFYAALGGGAKPEATIFYPDYIAAAGSQGWEMVSAGLTDKGEREFWFKRPAR